MPSLTHYDALMLRGSRALPVINRLGGGAVAMASDGQPWRVVGDTSVVYQLRQPNGRLIALRCFLADTVDDRLANRYRALAATIATGELHAAEASPIVGGLTFHPEGVTETLDDFRSLALPVVAMDWVMGPTLMAAVHRAATARDGAAIARLAEGWRAACVSCAELGFVHGDLNGDNIIVPQAQPITLVDYDTALWPGALSIPSPASNPAYRHPRGATTDAVRRDEFAAFVIYASLRILSRWPELRDDHGDQPQERGGALLFRPRDLASPDGSALFGKIRVLDDPFIRSLGGILRETCRGKPDETPSFVDALAMANNVARRVSTAPPSPPPGQLERRTRVSSLIDPGTSGQWSESRQSSASPTQRATEPSSPPVARRPPKEDLGAAVRQTSAAQLRAALEVGDLATAERLWVGLQDTAEGGPYAVALAELRSTLARAAVRDALIKRDDELLVRAVERATELGVPLSTESRREARAAGLRLDIEFELERALETDDDAVLVDLALSGDLDELAELDDGTARRVVQALSTAHLIRALATDDDGVILQACTAETLADGAGLTDGQRRRVELARRRVEWRADLRAALRTRDAGAVAMLHVHAPEGAISALSETDQRRVERIQGHAEAVAALRKAVDAGDDPGIVDAFRVIETLGVPLGDGFPWLQLRRIVDRYSIIAAVRRAAAESPRNYERLARLLPQLRQATGEERPYLGEGISYEELAGDIRRNAQIARIREALRSDDDRTIVTAALPDLFGAIPLLTRAEQGRIERASAAIDRELRRSSRPHPLGQTPSTSRSSAAVETT